MSSENRLRKISAIPERPSLSDDVVERLRAGIWSGQLQPGMRLREEELAELLQVSRGPIREAIAQLEREGLVIKPANRSAVVARLSREDLEEVYSLRVALEKLAVQQAIQYATSEQLAELQHVVDEIAACLERGITEQQAAELDIQFHEIIFQAANHKRLYDCWAVLRPQIHIFLLSRNVANPDFREYILSTHQALADAISSRNGALAEELTVQHLHAAYERILVIYSSPTDENEDDQGESSQ